MADFDPAAFLDAAEYLLRGLSLRPTAGSDRDQALVRSSLSRSYYAAFLTAREKLTKLGQVQLTTGPRDHAIIAAALAGHSVPLGSDLDRLRMKRNQADYNLNPRGLTLAAGQYWLALAHELINEINQLS